MLALAACTAVQRCRRFSHCDVLLRVARPHLTKPDQSLCCLAPSGFPCRRRRQRHHFHPLWRLGGILRASPDACSLTRKANSAVAVRSLPSPFPPVRNPPSPFPPVCALPNPFPPVRTLPGSCSQPVLVRFSFVPTNHHTSAEWACGLSASQAPYPPHTSLLLHPPTTLTANTVLRR